MNIYTLTIGPTQHFVAARDEEHAYEQGTNPEQFPDIHFLPFRITKVEVKGHTITVVSNAPEEPLAVEEEPTLDFEEAAEPTSPRRGRRSQSV